MAETLYKRCPTCDQFLPEAEQLCRQCGHTFDSSSSRPRARKWLIRGVVVGGLVLLLILSFVFESRPTSDFANSPVVSRPTWTSTPAHSTPVHGDRNIVESNATKTPDPGPFVRVDRDMNVRGGPGTYYPIVDSAWPGEEFLILAKNSAGDWWQINYEGSPVWIYAPLVEAIGTAKALIGVLMPPTLTSAQVFNRVAPAIAYVQTDERSGSGVLIEGRYLVTNHHVVWPFDTARVVFPNGAEFDAVGVKGWDREADLAVLGPIDTATHPVPLIDGESTPIGADMYLIGYPAEFELFPQPTIVKGILSRLRQSGSKGITYFQTDASIAGGQSGGALVSEAGAVIGISGSSIADGKFALVASSADLLPRIRKLIAGGGDPVSGERRRRAAVRYDGGIDLLGLALEQGEERLSSRELIVLRQDLALWVGMRWQITPGLAVNYAISLRLHDKWSRRVFQQDEVLTNSDSRLTRNWSAQEPVDTWFPLDLPADLPPGDYELRLVVYNIESLTPTVEIDVWEPDVLVARLQSGEGQ